MFNDSESRHGAEQACASVSVTRSNSATHTHIQRERERERIHMFIGAFFSSYVCVCSFVSDKHTYAVSLCRLAARYIICICVGISHFLHATHTHTYICMCVYGISAMETGCCARVAVVFTRTQRARGARRREKTPNVGLYLHHVHSRDRARENGRRRRRRRKKDSGGGVCVLIP